MSKSIEKIQNSFLVGQPIFKPMTGNFMCLSVFKTIKFAFLLLKPLFCRYLKSV
jgi:hypothetical protein